MGEFLLNIYEKTFFLDLSSFWLKLKLGCKNFNIEIFDSLQYHVRMDSSNFLFKFKICLLGELITSKY